MEGWRLMTTPRMEREMTRRTMTLRTVTPRMEKKETCMMMIPRAGRAETRPTGDYLHRAIDVYCMSTHLKTCSNKTSV
jgi:hypothetical protein